jgi:membrane-bound lytic murein transglycosylase A
MSRSGAAALVLAVLLLHACATPQGPAVPSSGQTAQAARPIEPAPLRPTPPAGQPEPSTAVSPPAPPLVDARSPAKLPGWANEDHLAALHAWQVSCPILTRPADKAACAAAQAIAVDDEGIARRYFENNFTVEPLADPGLLTAYFSPEYEARDAPDDVYRMPVRSPPADLRLGKPYAARAAIEARPPNDAIAWMKPEDLFFLQIQGSGTLLFPDGRKMKAVFAAHNGLTFKGIANPMRDRGLLPGNDTSGDAIRGWLADHRGPEANAIMRLNPRYVFFTLAPDDGAEPVGAAGIALPPGHAVAVDPAAHTLGELIWIDAASPILSGAFPSYQRLVVALDTGGAIKGQVRADLYMGRGAAAGAEAGRVRHSLRMYRIVPIDRTAP